MKSTEQTRKTAQNVLDWIHENPKLHDQENVYGKAESGVCGTTMCIAGNVLAQKFDLKTHDQFENWFENNGFEQTPPTFGYRCLDNSEYEWIRMAGTELGLDQDEAFDLFYTLNNEEAVQKLKHIVVGESWEMDEIT